MKSIIDFISESTNTKKGYVIVYGPEEVPPRKIPIKSLLVETDLTPKEFAEKIHKNDKNGNSAKDYFISLISICNVGSPRVCYTDDFNKFLVDNGIGEYDSISFTLPNSIIAKKYPPKKSIKFNL